MYRPGQTQYVQQTQPAQYAQPPRQPVRAVFFSEKNYQTLQTVLLEDFERNGRLTEPQTARLTKTLDHYLQQVYDKQGEKPLPVLNREVLVTCSKDFAQYLQRKEVTKGTDAVKTVMDETLFQETSQRFERITSERNEVKALPPSVPDFRISLTEDGPPAAEMFERAKKQREFEALRAAAASTELKKAEVGLVGRIQADSAFRALQDEQNQSTERALVLRSQNKAAPVTDAPLALLPDRRELLMGAIGSFDGLLADSQSSATRNPTVAPPMLTPLEKPSLAQHLLVRENSVVSYREVENNLFLYSADRDWLKNNKENRYSFTVNFDPAANTQNFGPTLAAQQKFKNIVRIELVKAILPGESLSVTVNRNTNQNQATDTSYQDNILNLPFVTVRVAELENNNYGTDQFLDRSFGVLQYDDHWRSDDTTQSASTKGFLAMIPKFLKCQKEYYPTPMSTLQKMTVDIRRPNGELVSSAADTLDVLGVLAPQTGSVAGGAFPFTLPITFGTTATAYNVMIPAVNGDPANFLLVTAKYFSKFEMCVGDRIQVNGYTYAEEALNDPTYGQTLRAFSQWVNRSEGHVILGAAYTPSTTTIQDGFNEVGYANVLAIPARMADPTTGSILPLPFGANLGAALATFGAGLASPIRLINLNKQTTLVFRIITREMDALPGLRPDNTY